MKNRFCLREHIIRTILEGLQECFACGTELEVNDFKDLCNDCWRKSGGGVFDKKLNVNLKEWEKRKELLKNGGELDFGTNGKFIPYNPQMEVQLPVPIRASVRLNKEKNKYEAYAMIYDPRTYYEISLFLTNDIKQAFRAAILTGPYSNSMVKMILKERHKNQSKKEKDIFYFFGDYKEDNFHIIAREKKLIAKDEVVFLFYYCFFGEVI